MPFGTSTFLLLELPCGSLQRSDLLSEPFLLAREGRLAVYWSPFERLNPTARLVIVGLTPGYGQMAQAFTAARDAVLAGNNYGGANPPVRRSGLLSGYVRDLLGRELKVVPTALILPLGKATEGCHRMLVDDGALDAARCLFGFPHPSGGNGHRVRQFQQHKAQLQREIAVWSSAYAP